MGIKSRHVVAIILVVLATTLAAEAAARESCNPKDIHSRISKRIREASPIYACQVDFTRAKTCCLFPERCTRIVTHNNIQESMFALSEYKKLKERELQVCEVKIKAARRSCENDHVRLAILKREFNDVLICADDKLAQLNGRIVKTSSDNRFAYEADNAPESREPASGELNRTPAPPAAPPASAALLPAVNSPPPGGSP